MPCVLGVPGALAVLLMLGACASSAPVPVPLPAPAPAPGSVPGESAPPGLAPGAPANASPLGVPTTASPDAASQPERFARWVAGFRADAAAQGIGEATLAQALDGLQYLPEVVERDRSQAEFTRSPWDYLDRAVSAQRVAAGQARLAQVGPEAGAAAARYGVPAPVLVAVWGMESNYGSNFGSTPTLDALATLGFDGRREAWARRELLAALRILENRDIDRAHMIGSWAGAMGQTQFLPSNFLAYAVDADGDGRRDIWGSMADVMASTANFLARSGWQAGQPWGLEVRLPAAFDVGRADPALRQGSAAWAAEGVQSASGLQLPDLGDATLMLPAGARGPAFLVGPGFRAILRYNNSTNYALAVGLLAQRIAGAPGVQAAWPRDLAPLGREQVLALQAGLNQRGFDTGPPDGLVGPATRDGLRRFQRSVGLPPDGFPTLELLQRLQAQPS